jgi:hypothetical protein
MQMNLMADVGRAAFAGAIAGAAGTLAMDLLWFRRSRRGGETASLWDWETAKGTTQFSGASAPAQIAQRVASLAGHPLPDRTARTATNAVHWTMGIGWGAAYGVSSHLVAPGARPAVAAGFAPTVLAVSYITLGALGVYRPIWEYPVAELGEDLGAHALYGATTAAVYQGLVALPSRVTPSR